MAGIQQQNNKSVFRRKREGEKKTRVEIGPPTFSRATGYEPGD